MTLRSPVAALGMAVTLIALPAAAENLGPFTARADVGDVSVPGRVVYDGSTYRITASGANIWANADAFHFVYQPAAGDLALAARVAFEGSGGDPHRKAGVMVRQSLDADSPYADIMLHGNGHIDLQYRETKGGDTREIGFDDDGVTRVELERQGDYVYMWAAKADGVLHPVGGGFRLKLDGSYLAGLAVCAHNNATTETADFSEVAVTPQAPFMPTETGYNAKVESTLETIDVASTYQRVVYHTTDHIEAPNWLPGDTLLFNAGGSLYTLPVAGGTPVGLDTGGLHRINNDHGFSPDHQWLAISDQTSADAQSRVYVLPLTGGQPRQITPQGPSYWHGWSPDGKTLAVIANRNNDFDIYAIPVKEGGPVEGGTETRLTTTPGLDDGSDYTPDGQWIWFNSVRSGNMKLWRMHPDGSGAEQMTTGDDSRDWFPHPSPDGKWIAFVSFGTEVAVGDHPPNHDVMIKIMPAAGGEARVIARLFGGQGTMNVNSWSPDSTKLAFVSYRIVP